MHCIPCILTNIDFEEFRPKMFTNGLPQSLNTIHTFVLFKKIMHLEV